MLGIAVLFTVSNQSRSAQLLPNHCSRAGRGRGHVLKTGCNWMSAEIHVGAHILSLLPLILPVVITAIGYVPNDP